ncbi:hypothetical protein ACQ4PT_035551 [Festuca glaucescens]
MSRTPPPRRSPAPFLAAAAATPPPPPLLSADAAPVAQRLLLEFAGTDEAPPKAKGKGEDAAGEENGGIREVVQRFEGEEIEALERKKVAFRLILQVLGGEAGLEPDKVAKVRNAAAWQVRSLTDFLKIRKRDWKEQGVQLRARINTKLSCCQAAVVVLVWCVSVMDAADRKASKDMLQQTPSRADMTGCSPGALFEAVVKLSCEIIEFGWTKDKALVDTFIMRLAAYVRERNDYEEEAQGCIILEQLEELMVRQVGGFSDQSTNLQI